VRFDCISGLCIPAELALFACYCFLRFHDVLAFSHAQSIGFLLLFPGADTFPLQSLSRLILEVFPAFLVLAAMGKNRQFYLYYLVLSVSLLSFMLLQFLSGHWIV